MLFLSLLITVLFTIPVFADGDNSTRIRVQFAGDVLLHGSLGTGIGSNRYDYRPFMQLIRYHVDGDLNLINMETPVDTFGNNSRISTWPRFNVPFEILDGLMYAGFNHLITANNHSFDQGWNGLRATIANFERAGIKHTGMFDNLEDFLRPHIVSVQGINVGIIAYTDSVNGLEGLVPAQHRPYAVRRFRSNSMLDIPIMSWDIANTRNHGADVVIVSLHWGAEYVHAPNQTQRNIARALIDAGADIVMGHHSHTPQPLEWHYREDGTRGLIIYSLGNFIADQIRLGIPATQYGMLVTVYIAMDEYGSVALEAATVLPTLFARDTTSSLGTRHIVIPIISGEAPEAVTREYLRAWSRRAYDHVRRIVGDEFMQP